ncbi:Site-specific recombinase XerD [Dehalogenimonas alkenigignens]|uniref:Site-specific recombinase XerD n=1 Tax=Dehalogenimonas alkenigignens TaxID=1217799 RepID=A0A0W0GJC7_9CHLR|nr:tyrosine-type recombinase/integrase [Dehalogenimonas alkenigignens]KTB48661.1 Site-specific recombinase XerD [Dehalogenimonas alkenigignens]
MSGEPHRLRTCNLLIKSQRNTNKLLNKLTVTELALLSGLSKSYISQVKSSKRPPSEKLLRRLNHKTTSNARQEDYVALFISSRTSMGVSPKTLRFYLDRLGQFERKVSYLKANKLDIELYLNTIPPNKNGLATRHASYRAIKAFYAWLESTFEIKNPISNLTAPILSKVIMPSLTKEQVQHLIEVADNQRDKAIIALFVESGLRLSELSNIQAQHIDWSNRTIQVLGKGRKEALAPFGELSEGYIRELLSKERKGQNIWGINHWGIVMMLRRLEERTGLPCNPHTFRRTFACLLRKAGVDTMTIKDLGRWESIEMVQRYTRSIRFQDSLKFYSGPLSV